MGISYRAKTWIIVFATVVLMVQVAGMRSARATHLMAADLWYQWIDNCNFIVKAKLYRDCEGISAPNYITLDFNSTCDNFSVYLPQISSLSGIDVSQVCDPSLDECNGGAYEGTEVYFYRDTVNICAESNNPLCSDWTISWASCCRNYDLDNITSPGSKGQYLFTTLDNYTGAPVNNSTFFTVLPTPYICDSQCFCFNHGAIDPDGDSLVYYITEPRGTWGMPIPYSSPYSKAEPLPTGGTFHIDSTTGEMCFYPTDTGQFVVAMAVEQWRNNMHISTTIREMQIVVEPCTNQQPIMDSVFNVLNGSTVPDDTTNTSFCSIPSTDISFEGCQGDSFSFDMVFSDPDITDTLYLSSNLASAIPGANITTSGTNPLYASFGWRPNTSDTGTHVFVVKVTDSVCPVPAINYVTFSGTVDMQRLDVIRKTPNDDSVALEGCFDASFTFTIDTPESDPVDISFKVGGSALNGIDYKYIDSLLTIPPGDTSATIIIDAFADGIPESQETVEIIFRPSICSPYDTVVLYINDATPVDFTLSGTDLGCFGDSSGIIDADITGGFPPYSVVLNEQDAYDSVPIYNLPADTYLVHIKDKFGCVANAVAAGGVDSAGLTFIPDGNGNSYSTSINVTTFDSTDKLTDLDMLQSICISMEHSFIGEVEIKLIAPDSTTIILKEQPGGNNVNFGEPVAVGPVDANSSDTTPGLCYEYCFNVDPVYGTMVSEAGNYTYTYTDSSGNVHTGEKYLPSGSYQSFQPLSGLLGVPLGGDWTIVVNDNNPNDNGYICNWTISFKKGLDSTVILDEPDEIGINDSVTFTGCGDSTGSIDITPSGDFAPFSYNWSSGDTTQYLSGLPAGSYTVTVTDSNNCTSSKSFLLQNISSMTLSDTVTHVSCKGMSDGAINLDVSGGITPYNYNWSTGDTTPAIGGLTAGNYTVTVTDSAACITLSTIAVTEPNLLQVNSANIINEKCGKQDGAIDIGVAGGTTPYSYNWSTGATTQDINQLSQGTYTVVITDSNNCTTTDTFSLINEVGSCVTNCDIYIDNATTVDENCGDGTGAINITVSDGTPPYTYAWSTGATTEDISGLNAGIYTVTVQDTNACQVVDSFTINNNSGGFEVSNTVVTNEICGNGSGSIDNTVNGGVLPYSYLWSDGQTTQDATGLSAGTYTCTITDANGCQITMSATVQNDAGNFKITNAVVVDEMCGDSLGAVDISVTGGTTPYFYSWSNGATTQDLTGLAAGNYSVTVTDADGCQISSSYTVSDAGGSLSIYDKEISNEVCGDTSGYIRLFVNGGTNPYSFSWNTGDTTQDIYNLSAGTYACTVTDSNGCVQTTGNINISNTSGDLSVDGVSVVDEVCGNGQGYINLTVSGSATPLTFNWSNGSTSEDITGISAGTYSCTITDTNGCVVTTQATVNNTSGTLSIDNMVAVDEVCGNGQGSVTLFLSWGTSPYDFIWSNGDTTKDINGLSAGTFSVTVTDSNGCMVMDSTGVGNDAGTLGIDNISLTNEVCGNANGAIDLTVSGGTIPYSYMWNTGDTTEDLTGLSAGTYACTIIDSTSCSVSTGQLIVNDNPGTLSVVDSVSNESCGNASGAVDLTVTGGTMPYSYIWSTGDTTEDLTGLSSGAYSYTVTGYAGCTVTNTVNVLNDAGTLSLDNFSISDEQCGDTTGAIDLTVSGGTTPYSFNWSTGDITEDISGIQAGTYTVTIIDGNSCTIADTFNVQNNPGSLTLDNIFVNDESCSDASGYINITITGGTTPYSFAWSNGDTTEDITGLGAGTYTCQVTDAAGCSLIISATVQNDAGPLVVSDSVITHEYCSNGQGAINVDITGGTMPYNFVWSNGDTTEDISGLSAGSYTLLVSDSGGCSSTYDTTVMNIGSNLAISSATVTDVVCGSSTGAIDITVSGGATPYSYLWNTGATTEDISSLGWGTYSVTVTDANGCIVNGSYNVQNNSSISINNVVITHDSCADMVGAIDISVSGGTWPYYYSWSNGATSQDINNLSAGTYTVTVTDYDGCNSFGSFQIVGDTMPPAIASAVITDEICGDTTGAINISLSGGTAPYFYSWSNGATTQDISNLNADTFSLTVTDNFNCTVDTALIVQDSSGTLNISNISVTDVTCDTNGSVDITVSGGTLPYSFNWSNGATSEDISNLAPGSYTVEVSDSEGCMTSTIANVNDFSIGFSNTNVTHDLCGDSLGFIDVTINGGITPYTYAWSNGATSQDIDSLSAGTYTLTVTDSTGCTKDTSFTLTNPAMGYAISNMQIAHDTCGNGGGWIDITVSSGTAPYTFNWSNGATSEDVTGLTQGTYSVTVTDANGCKVDTSASIINIAGVFTVSDTNITSDSCNFGVGAIDITVIGGTPPYNYTWSTGDTTQDINGLIAGSYSCTITDIYGCALITGINVPGLSANLSIDSMLVTDENCGNGQGAINLFVSGGKKPYQFDWSTGDTTEDLNGLSKGLYIVTVLDANGCSVIDSAQVNNPFGNNLQAGFNYTVNNKKVTFINTSTGANSYQWNFGDGNTSTFPDPMYTYAAADTYKVVLIAKDGNGCTDTATKLVVVGPTGIGQMTSSNYKFKVYPNPAKQDNITVRVELPTRSPFTITILNVLGEEVYVNSLTKRKCQKEINISELKSGVYYVKLNSSQIFEAKRLVILR